MGLTATNGTLSGPVNGEYTFTPDDDFSGTVELSYQVVDDQGAATEASQSFTIGAVNDGPTNLFRQAIIIPAQGPANPYPVANQPADISGLTGSITDLNVTLKGLSHTNPDDLDILLVGPAGQTVALMSDMGGSFIIDNVNLTFDDAAPAALPDASQITSGVYRPGNIGLGDILPGDISSNVIKLSGFNGTNPNGIWQLYISDDLAANGGSLEGYELRFTTSTNEVFTYSATTTGSEIFAAATNEDTPLAFSTLMGNAISISDIDAGDSNIQVTLSVTNGSLSLGSQTGITVEGDGTTLTLTGPVAALNTALNGLTFSPTTGYAGAASLTIDTNDLGANGTGGPLSDSDTIDITINPVDDGQITDLVITGTNAEGAAVEEQSLSAIFTLGSDPDGVSGTPNVTYQWQQFNAELEQWDNISGANGESFTPNDAQFNAPIRVQVTYTDAQNFTETIASEPTAPTAPVNDGVGESSVSITGEFTEGVTLESLVLIDDPDGSPLAAPIYRWEMAPSLDTPNEGWTAIGAEPTLTLDDAQANQYVRLVIIYTDAQNFTETLISTATQVTAVDDGPITGLTISTSEGPIQEEAILVTNFDTIKDSDPDGLPQGDPTYQWQESDGQGGFINIDGATGNTFIPDDGQVGKVLRVVVNYIDGQGIPTEITATTDSPLTAIDDSVADGLLISGQAIENVELTALVSSLEDPEGLSDTPDYVFQWQQFNVELDQWENMPVPEGENPETFGKTASFTPNDPQVGKQLRVLVTYTDAQGFRETIESGATEAIQNVDDDPTGTVAIEGALVEGTQLTINTSTLDDEDGLGPLSYQWQQSEDGLTGWINVPVPEGEDPALFGKTTFFTPDDAQVNKYLRVVVTYTDGQGLFTTINDTATSGPIENVNDNPTVEDSLSISLSEDNTQSTTLDLLTGSADEDGDILTVDNLQITNGGNAVGITQEGSILTVDPAAYNYLKGDETEIIEYSYTIADGNEGTVPQTATISISGVNDPTNIGGTTEQSITEDATDPETGEPVNTVGGTLTISDDDAGEAAFNAPTEEETQGTYGSFTFNTETNQWTYTLDNTDPDTNGLAEGQQVSDTLTLTSTGGVQQQLTVNITGANDPPAGEVTISGEIKEGVQIQANTDTLADPEGLGAISLQWQRSATGEAGTWTNITNATLATFTPNDAQVGQYLRVQVTYTDQSNTAETINSAVVGPVVNVNDDPIGNVVITVLNSGNVEENQTLSANASTITDEDGLGELAYQWQSFDEEQNAWVNLADATTTTLLLGDNVIGKQVRMLVSYTDLQGKFETVVSAAVGPVANVNDLPVGKPIITGQLLENETLAVDIDGISDGDGLGDFDYQWQVFTGDAWENIPGATAATYDLTNAEVDQKLRVQVSYTDGHGTNETVLSVATEPVININDAPVVNPLDTFEVRENSPNTTLIGKVGATDPDGDTLTYSITSGNDNGLFSINPTNGNLRVADSTLLPDFEKNPTASFNLTVRVADNSTDQPGPLFRDAALTINLADVNEHSDFNRDYSSDIVWRDLTSGSQGVTFLDNSDLLNTVDFSIPVSQSTWTIEGVGDFDGDKKEDDLIWRDYSTGSNVIWLTEFKEGQGGVIGGIPLPSAPVDWQLSGVGDFDKDGYQDDLVFYTPVTKLAAIWYWDEVNQQPSSSTLIEEATWIPGTSWSIGGVGSFDEDGVQDDLFWRNTSDGQNVVWFMEDGKPTGSIFLDPIPTIWDLKGISDFDGDLQADDLMWHWGAAGRTDFWYLDGTTLVGGINDVDTGLPSSAVPVV
jgi:VCBS repeat-containing protein